MPRTTVLRVEKLVEVDPTIDVDPFIESASALVDDVCVPEGYNDTRLELIERWLSAHFYTIRDNRLASEGVGRGAAQASYQYSVGLFLKNSMQGQQAMLLDTKGGLAALDKKMQDGGARKMDITWMGEDECGEVDRSLRQIEEDWDSNQ